METFIGAIAAAQLSSNILGCPVLVTKNPWRGQPGRFVKIVGQPSA